MQYMFSEHPITGGYRAQGKGIHRREQETRLGWLELVILHPIQIEIR